MKSIKLVYIYLNDLGVDTANVNQTFNMINALANHCDVTFISSWINRKKLKQRLSFFAIEKRFKHIKLPIKLINKPFFLEKISRGIYALLTLFLIRLKDYDVLYTRDFSFLYFLSIIPKRFTPSIPVIYEPHTIYHKSSPKVSFNQEVQALKMASFFIPISYGIQKDLIKSYQIQADKIAVLPDAVNLENFRQITPNVNYLKHHYPNIYNYKIIIYVGSFKNWKGVDTLVKAIKYIQHSNFKVLLIGGVGKDRERIEELIELEGCQNKVVVEGFHKQNHIIQLLKMADVGIIPNTKEKISASYTSPLKVFEYMACGLPIVASELSSLKEIITNKKNCIFFEAENEKDLGTQISGLLKNEELCTMLSENNIAKSKQSTWSSRALKIKKISENIIYKL